MTDTGYLDLLTANVTWYRNNVTFESNLINMTAGVENSDIMEASNTSIGQEWHCQVIPIDNLGRGTGVNSTHRIILDNQPPSLSNIECERNNATWIDCTALTYGQNLTRVRANCTDDGFVRNVTFKFYNIEDNRTYFNQANTHNVSNTSFILNNTDLWLLDSGNFQMNVTCYDNASTFVESMVNWSLPFGTLTVSNVNPAASTSVQINAFFTYTASVTCTGGECGDLNATLDPATATLINETPDTESHFLNI